MTVDVPTLCRVVEVLNNYDDDEDVGGWLPIYNDEGELWLINTDTGEAISSEGKLVPNGELLPVRDMPPWLRERMNVVKFPRT